MSKEETPQYIKDYMIEMSKLTFLPKEKPKKIKSRKGYGKNYFNKSEVKNEIK
jgi:hypothetical protein